MLVCARESVVCASLVRLLLSATGTMLVLPWGCRGAAVVPWGLCRVFMARLWAAVDAG